MKQSGCGHGVTLYVESPALRVPGNIGRVVANEEEVVWGDATLHVFETGLRTLASTNYEGRRVLEPGEPVMRTGVAAA